MENKWVWTKDKFKEQVKKDVLAAMATAKISVCARDDAIKYFSILFDGTLESAKEIFKEKEDE